MRYHQPNAAPVAHPQTLHWIQVCRGVAALLVVAKHARIVSRQSPILFSFGGAGVDFFFVLSGFILYYTYHSSFDRPESLLPYLKKRFWRIYPVYWATMMFALPALLWMPNLSKPHKQSPAFILASLLLLPQNDVPVLGVSWSLSYEVVFYLVFGLCLWRRAVGFTAMALWGGLAVTAVAIPDFGDWSFLVSWLALPRVLELFFGVSVGFLVVRRSGKHPRTILTVGALSFASIGVTSSYVWGNPSEALFLVFGVSAALVIYGCAVGELSGQLGRAPRWTHQLGEASYSIYLTHYLAIAFQTRVWRRLPPLPAYLFAFVFAVGVGVLFHMFVEGRILRLRPRTAA